MAVIHLVEAGTLTVYALVDPHTKEVRYVGATWRTPKQRLVDHLAKAKYTRKTQGGWTLTETQKWILSLQDKSRRPIMVVLEEAKGDGAPMRELFWIEEMQRRGARLCNANANRSWRHIRTRKNPPPTSLAPVPQ